MKELLIGTSGWSYNHWRSRFYPDDLADKNYLKFYSNAFETVEINASFYRLPTAANFATWRLQTPPGFIFSIKASRYLTHIRKLTNPEEPWRRFYNNARALREKMGPILFQFPANWRENIDRLKAFLEILPKDVRYVFEFRHQSWFNQDVFDLLKRNSAAICQADSSHWPKTNALTAPFVFIRMHGAHSLYTSRYSQSKLKNLARRAKDYLHGGLDVYIYFNNDAEANAVKNAGELRKMF